MGTLMLIGAQLFAGPCGYTNHKKMHFYYKILSQDIFMNLCKGYLIIIVIIGYL